MSITETRSKLIHVERRLVFDDAGNFAWLQRRPDSKNNANLWEGPGGAANPDDPNLLFTLKRELSEEFGRKVTLVDSHQYRDSRSIYDHDEKERYQIVIGLARVAGVKPQFTFSKEHIAGMWLPEQEALDTLDLTPECRAAFEVERLGETALSLLSREGNSRYRGLDLISRPTLDLTDL